VLVRSQVVSAARTATSNKNLFIVESVEAASNDTNCRREYDRRAAAIYVFILVARGHLRNVCLTSLLVCGYCSLGGPSVLVRSSREDI